MRWKNTADSYGVVAIALHWLVAITVVGLFALGLWMRSLTYYDSWYDPAPTIHKGVGVLLFLALIARLGWRRLSPVPPPVPTLTPLEHRAAGLVHGLLYVLLLVIMLSGYLICTADGHALGVFGLFSIPATLTGLPDQADVAGAVHLYLAYAIIALASVHALAALKHHFIDRDRTLVRMLGRRAPAATNHDTTTDRRRS
jgi:cytochrome b561